MFRGGLRKIVVKFAPLVLAALALGRSVALALLSVRTEPPDLTLNPEGVDFGTVQQHAVLSRRVELANPTSSTVKIVGVYPSCDCAETAISTRELPAGAIAHLDAVWKVGARHGDCQARVQLATFSDGRTEGIKVATITLRAHVLADYELVPDEIVWRDPKESAVGRSDNEGGAPNVSTGNEAFIRFVPADASSEVALLDVFSSHDSVRVRRANDGSGFSVEFDASKRPTDRSEVVVDVRTTSANEPVRRYVVRLK